MALYFFNIVQGGYVRDDEGMDLPDIVVVREEAKESAREIIVEAIRAGHPIGDGEIQAPMNAARPF